jgi:hypothetical protein
VTTDNPATQHKIKGNVNYQSLNVLNEIEDLSDLGYLQCHRQGGNQSSPDIHTN